MQANQPQSSVRFQLVTDRIDVSRLEHETDRILGSGLLIAMLLQALLLSFPAPNMKESHGIRAIPVSLHISTPRLLRPYSVASPDRIRPEPLRKTSPLSPPPTYTGTRPITEITPFGEVPLIDLGDMATYSFSEMETFDDPNQFVIPDVFDILAEYMSSSRTKEMSLRESLLTIDDYYNIRDEHNRLFLYNPVDPMSITGVVELAALTDFRREGISPGLIGLSEAMNNLTDIRTFLGRQLEFNHRRTTNIPFLFIGIEDYFEYQKWDIDGIRTFIEAGGFLLLENRRYITEFSPLEANLKQLMKDTFGSRVRFDILPNDHPVYHSYFHFDEPPMQIKIYDVDGRDISKPVYFIEGIFLDGRMVGIYSNKGWSREWEGTGPAARMGINMLVYALRNADNVERYVDTSLERGPNGDYASYFHEFTDWWAEQQ